MATAPTRSLEIKGTLEVQPTDIAERLKKIEEKLEAAKGKKGSKDFWDKLQASGATGIFSSLLLALIGFMLTGAISNSVQQRQIELASVEKMQSLISDLANPMAGEEQAEIKTTTLAAFGKPAVPAFINLLTKDNTNQVKSADKGLRMIGSAHPSWVCAHLTSILRNRSQLYSYRTFQHVLDLAADINCQSSQPAVEELKTDITTIEKLNALLSSKAEPKEFDDLRAKIDNVLERLRRGPQPPRWRTLKRFFHVNSDQDVEEAG